MSRDLGGSLVSATSAQLTIVGLGPGGTQYLTTEARQVLRRAGEIWLRTRKHPLGRLLSGRGNVHSFDDVYEEAASFDEVYSRIAAKVVELARRPDGVVYGVPGHPLVGEESVRLVLQSAEREQLAVHVVAGISFLEPVFTALRLDPLADGLQVVDATALVEHAAGADESEEARWARLLAPHPIRAIAPALVCQLYGAQVAAALKVVLLDHYPPEHPVKLVQRAGVRGRERVTAIPLFQLDRVRTIDHLTCLYLPPLPLLEDVTSFATLKHIIARLRAPGGCPWDREQTHQSLKPYLVEESYEVLEALDNQDAAGLEEELGDLLLQIVLHAQLAAEAGDFGLSDVLAQISTKLIRRHPHVFGTRTVADSSEVVRNWEQIKRGEKGAFEGAKASLLGGVPKEMPALAHAGSIQRRVASLGFDWDDVRGALEKLSEEVEELRRAASPEAKRAEFGDVLFALVGAARHLDVDAEEALRLANQRFMRRFAMLERLADRRALSLKALPAAELQRLWQEAKAQTQP